MQRLLNIRNTCARHTVPFPSTPQVPIHIARLFNSKRPSSTFLNISRCSDCVKSLEKRKFHTSPCSSERDTSKLEVSNVPHQSSKINESSSVDDVVKWAEQLVKREHALKLKAQEINGKALIDLDALSLERWGIPGGPASILANEIIKLKGVAQVPYSEILNNIDRMPHKNINLKFPRCLGLLKLNPNQLWQYPADQHPPFINRGNSILTVANALYNSISSSKPYHAYCISAPGMGKSRFLIEWPVQLLRNERIAYSFVAGHMEVDMKETATVEDFIKQNTGNTIELNRVAFLNTLHHCLMIQHVVGISANSITLSPPTPTDFKKFLQIALEDNLYHILKRHFDLANKDIKKMFSNYSDIIIKEAPLILPLFSGIPKECQWSTMLPLIIAIDEIQTYVETRSCELYKNPNPMKHGAYQLLSAISEAWQPQLIPFAVMVGTNMPFCYEIVDPTRFYLTSGFTLNPLNAPREMMEIIHFLFSLSPSQRLPNNSMHAIKKQLLITVGVPRYIETVVVAIKRFFDLTTGELLKDKNFKMFEKTALQFDGVMSYAVNWETNTPEAMQSLIWLISLTTYPAKPTDALCTTIRDTFASLEKNGVIYSLREDKHTQYRNYTLPGPLIVSRMEETIPDLSSPEILAPGLNPVTFTCKTLFVLSAFLSESSAHVGRWGEMVAATLRARYLIYCRQNGKADGEHVPLVAILPKECLPHDLQEKGVTVAIPGVYVLQHQFTSKSDIEQLRVNGVLVNKPSANHGDMFLQVWLRGASKIAAIGSKNTVGPLPHKKKPKSMKPFNVREEAEKVFTHDDFYYIHFSPLAKLPEKKKQNKKNVEWIEKHINRIGFTNGSGWIPIWFELYRDWTNFVNDSYPNETHENRRKVDVRK